jgi:hypothetical protein
VKTKVFAIMNHADIRYIRIKAVLSTESAAAMPGPAAATASQSR